MEKIDSIDDKIYHVLNYNLKYMKIKGISYMKIKLKDDEIEINENVRMYKGLYYYTKLIDNQKYLFCAFNIGVENIELLDVDNINISKDGYEITIDFGTESYDLETIDCEEEITQYKNQSTIIVDIRNIVKVNMIINDNIIPILTFKFIEKDKVREKEYTIAYESLILLRSYEFSCTIRSYIKYNLVNFEDIRKPKIPFKSRLYIFLRTYFNSLYYKLLPLYKKRNTKVKDAYISALEQTILSDKVLCESVHGSKIDGNIFYTIKELNDKSDLDVYISIKKSKQASLDAKIKKYNLKATTIVYRSKEYFELLARAKYLINDSTFPFEFIKREEQIYLNLWHGIPLKTMGMSNGNSPLSLANTQRNFYAADIINYDNEFMKEKFEKDYMLTTNNFYFSSSLKNKGFDNQETISKRIVWMPTWRGSGNTSDVEYNTELVTAFNEMIGELKGYEVFFNPHPFIKDKIKDLELDNLIQVSDEYELYDFLGTCETLITDYSSVMFDFAAVNKKVILYTPDIEDYLENRNMYLDIKSLPFDTFDNISELESILQNNTFDYTDFNKTYNPHINEENNLIEYMLNFKKVNKYNDKKKLLIFLGALYLNGITSAGLNLVKEIDKDEYDVFVFMPLNIVKSGAIPMIQDLIENDIKFIASPWQTFRTYKEEVPYNNFLNKFKLSEKDSQILNNYMIRESKRYFGDMKFHKLIDFSGYNMYTAKLFSVMEPDTFTYIHSNMFDEYKMRANYNPFVIFDAYEKSKGLIAVNGVIKSQFEENNFESKIINKIEYINNIINTDYIDKASEFYDYEIPQDLHDAFDDEDTKVIINVGRFSEAKAQLRLIEAFNKVKKSTGANSKLVLCGFGPLYEKIKTARQNSEYTDDIYIFNKVKPLYMVKRADAFVLSSLYEGLPIVYFETLRVGTDLYSTYMKGSTEMLEEMGCCVVVENSTDGVTEAVNMIITETNPKFKEFDFKKYNNESITKFYNYIEQ